MRRITIRPETLRAVGEALTKAHSLLWMQANGTDDDDRPAWTEACDLIVAAQLALAKDTRP